MSDIVLPNTIRSPYLVDFRAGDLSLTCRTGQVATLTRAGNGYALDANSRYYKAVQHQARWGYFGGVPHLLPEAGRTNEVTASCGFGAGSDWSGDGDFTIATAVSAILGQTAYKQTNKNLASSRSRLQSVGTLTANPETSSWVVENVDSLTTDIGVRDSTVGDWVGVAQFTWATGAIAVTGSGVGSGVSATPILLANSGPNGGAVYRLIVTGTPDNAGNSRVSYIYPTGTTQNALSSIIHQAQHEEAASASSPIITTTAAASRAADTFSIPYNAVPQEITVYAKFVETGSGVGPLSGSPRVFHIGATDATTDARLQVYGPTGYNLLHDNGTDAAVTTGPTATPSIGQVVELRAVLGADGSVQLHQSLDAAAETSTSQSSAPATNLANAWAGQLVYINADPAGANAGLLALREFRIALGTKTLTQMRAT